MKKEDNIFHVIYYVEYLHIVWYIVIHLLLNSMALFKM